MKNKRRFKSIEPCKSKQLGCWVDLFLDAEFKDDGTVDVHSAQIARGMGNRQHAFPVQNMSMESWELVLEYMTNMEEY